MNDDVSVSKLLSSEERNRIRDGIGDAIRAGVPHLEPGLDGDPGEFRRLIAATRVAAEASQELLEEAVIGARGAGLSWGAIGAALGVSRQAAQQRFAPPAPQRDLDPERKVLTGVQAFNERAVLEAEGRQGFHLVDFGALYLVLERSERPWEHRRLTLPGRKTRTRMEREGWVAVGAWFPFRYYKRPLPRKGSEG